MEYRNLGRSGIKVSALSIGTWITFGTQINTDQAVDLFKAAFDEGCNFIDCAEAYNEGEAERITGQALKKLGWDRSEYVISTKIFWGGKGVNQQGLSRKHLVEGTNKSLERLQLDYVDLLFCHRPDTETPMEEIVRAMNFLIDQGKTFYWGTSEWSAEQITEATLIAKDLKLVAPIMEQPQYNLLCRNRFEIEYGPLYEKYGIGTTIWSPLASGLLTGKYKSVDDIPENTRLSLGTPMTDMLKKNFKEGQSGREVNDPKEILQMVEKLKVIADRVGGTVAQLALAWTLKNKNVSTCITGASKVEQVKENFKSMEVYRKLTDQDLKEIDDIVGKPKPKPGFRRN
ncbi:voltage-gated potassium channel subunit beta [Acrasis kona]|uniref:Voltage-gated potassium channel subunit beta n=1 Tax=Acrasis kona TaxID=1008807 RepID=A0AAW2ZN95_9EUKA